MDEKEIHDQLLKIISLLATMNNTLQAHVEIMTRLKARLEALERSSVKMDGGV